MSADTLCDLDLSGVADAIHGGKASSVEVTEAYLRRIERHDRVLKAYITVMADRALARARTADEEIRRGARRGPLHGVPLALKDLVAIAGVRMTAGSRVMTDHVSERDADVTERLHAAGAVILGKLSMHEFAFGRPVVDGAFPTGRNPWDVTREPAGSSSGSGVAVAAGLCAGALGSDTGGSIRGPAARCGIVGVKPTYGLVSRRGVVALSWSLDHVGPMTRSVRDAAVLLQAIAGHDPGDPSTRHAQVTDYTAELEAGARGIKLGLLRRFYLDSPGLHAEVKSAALAAFDELKRQGATIEDVDAPTLDLAGAIWVTMLSEVYELHRETIRDQPQNFGEGIRTRIYMGALVTAADFQRGQRLRARLRREIMALFEGVDALVFPGHAAPAQRFEDIATGQIVVPGSRYTNVWNLLGLPAVVFPCGFSRDGLPVAIQIVGRPFDEATVFRIARAYERATDWHTKRPNPEAWTLTS
ncbi:MAG TPA: amidase [Candidatus Acidoferrum sp.]|nr:amidase [Candidatus Acidoferrum sp.]